MPIFLLSLVSLLGCQGQTHTQIKSEIPESSTNQSHSPYTELDWPQALHYFEQNYSALEESQNLSSKVNQLVQLLREFAVAWPKLAPFFKTKGSRALLVNWPMGKRK